MPTKDITGTDLGLEREVLASECDDCLPILLNLSVFTFYFFVFPLFSFWLRAVQIKLTYVSF